MILNNDYPPISTINLCKYFTDVKAVENINLQVTKGMIYALIGPNGAGKTTLLKLIVGLLSPSKGQAYITGFDINKEPLLAKQNFGYIPDDPTVYEFLTGLEFLNLTGNLRGKDKEYIKGKVHKLSTLFPLEGILEKPMSTYSRGNKQKVAFLAALLADPKVLLIDEPISGLDPVSIKIFGDTLQKFVSYGGTVLIISHSLPFVKNYANRVGLMIKGKIKKEKNISQISSLDEFMKIE